MSKSVREASHAGSWYTADGSQLERQLCEWMTSASAAAESVLATGGRLPRALIGPHAGYRYCGETAGHAYAYLARVAPSVRRVFVLGPSHHVYLTGCALPSVTAYKTPFGQLSVDTTLVETLMQLSSNKKGESDMFQRMSKSVDEDEHSLEMHLPYIHAAMRVGISGGGGAAAPQPQFAIVPMMVGQLPKNLGDRLGQLLAPYLDDPSNFFVISSDFCHWGKRFSYTPHDALTLKNGQPLWQSIEELDREGMQLITTHDPHAFTQYIKRTGNTVCGRNPITILLHAIQHTTRKAGLTTHFTHYSQSSRCIDVHRDSSVSYAAAVLLYHHDVHMNPLGVPPALAAQLPPALPPRGSSTGGGGASASDSSSDDDE